MKPESDAENPNFGAQIAQSRYYFGAVDHKVVEPRHSIWTCERLPAATRDPTTEAERLLPAEPAEAVWALRLRALSIIRA